MFELNMQEPVERKLGEVFIESTGRKETHYSYEVHLLLSLQQLLCDPFIFEEVYVVILLYLIQ